MKIDRLMGIVMHLLDHGRTPAQRLAERFEVSVRTILRDMDALDRAGIPVRSVMGADGGYELMEEFVLEKRAATREDMSWMIAALKGLATAHAGKDIDRALEKLNISGTPPAPVSMDLSAAAEDRSLIPIQQQLESAIRTGNVVTFTYTNSRGETKRVDAEPVQLMYRWYNWYLAAYSPVHADYRMYKLVRMADIVVTSRKNSRAHDVSAITFAESPAKMLHIRLRGKPAARARCREYLNGAFTAEHPDGSFEFSFSVPEHEFFWFGAILAMGSDVRVLEPPEVVERIVTACMEVQNIYEN